MARFYCYPNKHGAGYLLDCQADTLGNLDTRIVAPLMPVQSVPKSLTRLHPVFVIEDVEHLLATHLLSAVPSRELGPGGVSLNHEHDRIMAALDMLITGI